MYLRLSLIAARWDTDLSPCVGNVPAIHQQRLHQKALALKPCIGCILLKYLFLLSEEVELDMDHSCLEASWGCELNARAPYCVGCSPCVWVLHAIEWPKTSVWPSICGSAIGCRPPFAHSTARLLLPHCTLTDLSRESSSGENWRLTAWMWWTPDAGRNSSAREWREPRWENTAEEFNLHHPTRHLCSALCHLSPEAVAPFWPFTPSSVWASLDCARQLLVCCLKAPCLQLLPGRWRLSTWDRRPPSRLLTPAENHLARRKEPILWWHQGDELSVLFCFLLKFPSLFSFSSCSNDSLIQKGKSGLTTACMLTKLRKTSATFTNERLFCEGILPGKNVGNQ